MASGSSHEDQYVSSKGLFGIETEAEMLKKLQDCLEPLRENQIQIDSFSLSDMLNLGFMLNQMVKHVQVLTSIPYKDVRDSVLSKASSLGICPLSHEMNLRDVVEVCRWMKTQSGIKDVVEVQRSEKLKRRAIAKGKTVAESAMIRAFNAQFAEYSSELKKARAVAGKESNDSVLLLDKYWPVSAFDVANDTVHEEAVLDFCNKEGVKFGLFKFVEGLIERKKENYARREADNLWAVLKGLRCFEVPVSSEDGNCRVGEKRKDIGPMLDQGGETSSKMKKKI